jgi:hypothetical protein
MLRWKPTVSYPAEADLATLEERSLANALRFNEGMPPEQLEQRLRRMSERHRLESGVAFPLFGRILADGGGGVWLSDYEIGAAPDGPTRWSVIAANGEWLGTVDVPDRFRILDVRGDKVLGVLHDEMDVQSVAVFTLTSEPLLP